MFLTLIKHWKLILIGGLLSLALIQYEVSQKSDRAKEREFEAKVAELNLTKAVASTRAEVLASMTTKERETAQKVIAAGGRITSRTAADITIKDSMTAAPVYAPGASAEVKKAEINWTDEYGRFHLNLPSGLFTREQRFSWTSTLYVSPDGKTARFADSEFREFSPKTGAEIPSAGTNMHVEIKTILEKSPEAAPWHPRLVAIGVPSAFGLGVQANPWRGLILTAGGIYGSKNGVEGTAGLGWRLRLPFFDSTLGISGLAAYGKSGLRIAPAGTIELSR